MWEIFPREILLGKNDYFVEVYKVTEWLKVEGFSMKEPRPRGTRELHY